MDASDIIFVVFTAPFIIMMTPFAAVVLPLFILAVPGWIIGSVVMAAIDLWAFMRMLYAKIKSGEAWASLKQLWNSCCRR